MTSLPATRAHVGNLSAEEITRLRQRAGDLDLPEAERIAARNAAIESVFKLVRKYARELVRTRYHRLDCDDLIGETTLNLLTRFTQFNPDKGNFCHWVRLVCSNTASRLSTANDLVRIPEHEQRQPGNPIRKTVGLAREHAIPAPEPEPDQPISPRAELLREVVALLPAAQREILALRFAAVPVPYAEIARQTGVTPQAVARRFSRALTRTRKLLSALEAD